MNQLVFTLCLLSCYANLSSSCDSSFYCPGYLLDKIQRMKLFEDSKVFVDMPTRIPAGIVQKEIEKIVKSKNYTKESVKSYIVENFMEPGTEIQTQNLDEFTINPNFLKNISDPSLIYFSKKIIRVWPSLYRKVDKSIICKDCASSLLDTKNAFIIPGGRFREYYYFDTFFIMEGMLLSDLNNTTKEMIENFLEFVKKYGFVPNGSRIYFLNRSQPPFLIQMMNIYIKKTKDYKFLSENLELLEREYNYWIDTHSIQVPCKGSSECFLTRYHSSSFTPRPESYTEDIDVVESTNKTFLQKQELYNSLASATESGWDFSVRWTDLKRNGTIEESAELLKSANTGNIVPIDLNSYMFKNEKVLSDFYSKMIDMNIGNTESHNAKSQLYLKKSQERAQLMQELMWDKNTQQFYDYDFKKQRLQKFFSTASYTPFWAEALTDDFKKNITNIITPFKILENKLKLYKFGLPATEISSGLQWDYPNVWAPLVYLTMKSAQKASNLIESIVEKKKSETGKAQKEDIAMIDDLAFVIANRYIRTLYCTWIGSGGTAFSKISSNSTSNGEFYEKYSSEKIGEAGGGGEYSVQTGFGWTNGVALYFINEFKSKLTLPDPSDCQK